MTLVISNYILENLRMVMTLRSIIIKKMMNVLK